MRDTYRVLKLQMKNIAKYRANREYITSACL